MIAGIVVDGVCRDLLKRRVLAADADVIVTGDGDLLDLVKHKGIRIMFPRKFVEMLDRTP